jgi:hypothetical protein
MLVAWQNKPHTESTRLNNSIWGYAPSLMIRENAVHADIGAVTLRALPCSTSRADVTRHHANKQMPPHDCVCTTVLVEAQHMSDMQVPLMVYLTAERTATMQCAYAAHLTRMTSGEGPSSLRATLRAHRRDNTALRIGRYMP